MQKLKKYKYWRRYITSYYKITNDSNAVTNPQYNNVVVSENTAATLRVNNFETGTYILYQNAAGTQELQRNSTGIFIAGPIAGNTIFYVKYKTDKYVSKLVPITITTVKSSFFTNCQSLYT